MGGSILFRMFSRSYISLSSYRSDPHSLMQDSSVSTGQFPRRYSFASALPGLTLDTISDVILSRYVFW